LKTYSYIINNPLIVVRKNRFPFRRFLKKIITFVILVVTKKAKFDENFMGC